MFFSFSQELFIVCPIVSLPITVTSTVDFYTTETMHWHLYDDT